MINATLVVQLANFGIAYLLFDHILMRRAFAVLHEEDAEVHQAQAAILAAQQQVVVDSKHFDERVRECQRELSVELPGPVPGFTFVRISCDERMAQPSREMVADRVNRLQEMIVHDTLLDEDHARRV